MGLMDNYSFHDPHVQDPAMDRVWLALMCRPRRQRAPRPPKAPRPPRTSIPPSEHRCGHPWLHRFLMLAILASWLYWSVPLTGYVGIWLARRYFAPNNPLQLVAGAFGPLVWFCLVIPGVTFLLCLIVPWKCGGLIRIWQEVMSEPLYPP